jgi:geranylgeranyl diphosphate synthase type I
MTFTALLRDARTRVDERLAVFLAPRVTTASAISAEVGLAAEAVRDLSLRGGKRMRAALVEAGARAFEPGAADVCLPAMIAIELLQTYLLIHDDWMDDDDVRRGGPSVHVVLRERLGDKALGDAGAILAGDLASGWAQEALLESPAAPERVLRAARAYARINVDVVCGQLAEMTASSAKVRPSVETVHALKTASYTVTGPLLVGAALGGADEAHAAELERFGRPLGIAFQLRDDLLGTFGDPAATGKPIHNDIRQGKRTALVAELLRDPAGARLLETRDVDAIVRAMVSSGAKARVEMRVRELLDEARGALASIGSGITADGRALLEGAIAALGERSA